MRLCDGQRRWFHLTVTPPRDDWRAGAMVMHVNISERKRIEKTLQRQQTELRVLFDLMPAMIWFKDIHNGIFRVNQRVADAAGLCGGHRRAVFGEYLSATGGTVLCK